MKTISSWVAVFVLVFGVSPVYAGVNEAGSATTVWQTDYHRLTPAERLSINTQKAAENPRLRGRWDSKSHEPASSSAYIPDDLARDILASFRKDEALSNIPAYIKVRAARGNVVLEGAVGSEREKELIERRVRAMSGVRKVDSRLEVKNFSKEFLSD